MTGTSPLERLVDPGRIVLFDGAMGTMLYQRGVFINQCYDELSIRSPDLVREIHRQYVKAGAEVLETNSFGANRLKLTQYGLEGQVQALNRAAAELARDVADEASHPVLVAGAVGPLGVRLEPYGPTSEAEALAEWLHRRIRRELGVPGNRGKRYSWGYGACPDLDDHATVFKLLPAEEALGMELTSAFQLVPEQSTAAIIVHHPQAKYYAVRGQASERGEPAELTVR